MSTPGDATAKLATVFNVLVFACMRELLLEHVLTSLITAVPDPSIVRLKIWVDKPDKKPERREPVLRMMRWLPTWYPVKDVEVLVLERHMGCRDMWLSALSL